MVRWVLHGFLMFLYGFYMALYGSGVFWSEKMVVYSEYYWFIDV